SPACYSVPIPRPLISTLFPYTTLFRSWLMVLFFIPIVGFILYLIFGKTISNRKIFTWDTKSKLGVKRAVQAQMRAIEENQFTFRSEEHTSELQSRFDLVCRLLLEKKRQ